MSRALAVVAVLMLAASGTLWAQEPGSPDPCASTERLGELNSCWAREVERANGDMRLAYDALLGKLPRNAADRLKKAQKLWLEFRDAHVAMLTAASESGGSHGPEVVLCMLIAKRELTRRRTEALQQLLHPRKDDACLLP